jgi:hypothetical protein
VALSGLKGSVSGHVGVLVGALGPMSSRSGGAFGVHFTAPDSDSDLATKAVSGLPIAQNLRTGADYAPVLQSVDTKGIAKKMLGTDA